MNRDEWLLLNFTLPKEPSRIRVGVWRKLKKYGSVCLGQSMWILPDSKSHLDLFEEIAGEIKTNKGTAYVIKADFLTYLSDEEVIAIFNKVRDEEFKEFLDKCEDFFNEIDKETAIKNFTYAELEENEEEYEKLVLWLKKIKARDFFHTQLQRRSDSKLTECKLILDEFSNKVYQYNEEEQEKRL